MNFLKISIFVWLICCSFGCSDQEKDHKNAEIALQSIINKKDSMSDWRILIDRIKNADAGYAIQIQKKCYQVFHDYPITNQSNFRKLSKEDQNLILRSIEYGGPDNYP